jgi:hypothetical protein
MKRTLLVTAIMLATASFAMAQKSTSAPTGTTTGASGVSPGDRFNDTRGTANPGLTRGASELSPGDRMHDQTGTAKPRGASTFAPGHNK